MIVAFRISTMGFGGAERVFLSVADGLSARYGVKIHFVVDDISKGETENIVRAKGYELIGLSSQRTLKTIFPLKRYIEEHRPDVLISAYPDTNFAAIVSAQLAKFKCKVIVSEHAPIKEHWQHVSFKRNFLLNFYVRYGYRFATHILGVSKGLRAELLAFGHPENKVSYIHNPVRFSTTQDKNTSKNQNGKVKTIIAVGRITKQKDYMTLLKAFNALVKDLDNTLSVRLMIIGGVFETAAKESLDAYITENQLSTKVEFIGFTENVAEYYAKADIFALSSSWEGFGNVLVEALAFGLPIVATNCNYGPAEILENGRYGKLVPVGDWQNMAFAMQELLLNPHLFDAQTLKQRSLAFSESVIAEKYWQLIQKVTV